VTGAADQIALDNSPLRFSSLAEAIAKGGDDTLIVGQRAATADGLEGEEARAQSWGQKMNGVDQLLPELVEAEAKGESPFTSDLASGVTKAVKVPKSAVVPDRSSLLAGAPQHLSQGIRVLGAIPPGSAVTLLNPEA
jgi:hypothetical protein